MEQEKNICLYHRIMRRENFETAAKDLFQMLLNAQKTYPDQARVLYLDIDGHRNSEGGFDDDMLELQKEFGMGFLLPYFTEIHFPLISVRNAKAQRNDIPEGLEIKNMQNKKDTSLDELYIENYSNTEFMSEKEVYAYLEKVSAFLVKYNNEYDSRERMAHEAYDPNGFLSMWYGYIRDIINELFNAFIYGNLITTTAMTRTLIESYVYISIIKKEQDSNLLEQWFLCSTIAKLKRNDSEGELYKLVENYCEHSEIDFEEVYHTYRKGNENSWLASVIHKKRVTFRDACEYLGEENLYSDFQNASSFIHSQDIVSKIMPFTFYNSIYAKFYVMMTYIFKTISLIYTGEDMEVEIRNLYMELAELGDTFFVEKPVSL